MNADVGIDAKYGVTSSMTFDLTYNTDFAQVEIEPGSDLFVVYTDGRDTTGRGFSRLVSRGLAIKFTRFFRF